MKLLFDQNLSHKLVAKLSDLYPNSEHVRNVGMKDSTDAQIWEFARQNGFAIVTKDEDLHIRSVMSGPIPKVLWIRSGNCSTELVETLLRKNLVEIEAFDNDQETGFLRLV